MADSTRRTPGSGSGGSAASRSSSRAGRGFSSRSRTLARAAWKYASRSCLRANCHRPGGTSASGRSASSTEPETGSTRASDRPRSPSRSWPELPAFAAPSPPMRAACSRKDPRAPRPVARGATTRPRVVGALFHRCGGVRLDGTFRNFPATVAGHRRLAAAAGFRGKPSASCASFASAAHDTTRAHAAALALSELRS